MGKVSLGIYGNGAWGTRGCTALISSGYYQHIPPFAWTQKEKVACLFCDLCTHVKSLVVRLDSVFILHSGV